MHATEPGLAHYLHVLRRGLWIIALTVALTTGAAVYASKRQTALYSSSADVFLSTQNLARRSRTFRRRPPTRSATAATQADLARTPAVAKRALRLARLQSRSAAVASLELVGLAGRERRHPHILRHRPQPPDRRTARRRLRHRLHPVPPADSTRPSIVGARREIRAQLAKLKAAGEQRGAVYANLFEKDQQLRTMQALQGSNALLVRSASGAVQTQPRPTRNGALAAMLGLLLGVGSSSCVMRSTHASAQPARCRAGSTCLSSVASQSLRAVCDPGNGIVMLAEPLSPAAEPFRILATNLDFVNLERNARTIMFTSATHGEGKSTTVANLAVALARGGRRVILVDLDVRKPSLDGLFELGDRPGLTTRRTRPRLAGRRSRTDPAARSRSSQRPTRERLDPGNGRGAPGRAASAQPSRVRRLARARHAPCRARSSAPTSS